MPTSSGHADGTVEVAFGAIATAGGATPAWNGGELLRELLPRRDARRRTDTAPPGPVDGTEAACGSCHGVPPPAPHVSEPELRRGCHAGYTSTSVKPA